MKVLYDHQTFVYQNFGGISRYFVELASQLNDKHLAHTSISCLLSDNLNLLNSGLAKPISIRKGHFTGRMTIYNLVDRTNSLYLISRSRFDIFHPTYYDDYFFRAIGQKPFVITIYDMIHELYPGFWANQEDVTKRKKKLLNKASGIIAISENTKNDILRLYPEINASKIKVIHLGNSFTTHYTAQKHVKEKYILFVGIREHYKNFEKFLLAIQTVFTQFPDILLICAGGGAFTPKELSQIAVLGISKKVHYLPISGDDFLAGLYQHAILFVFPSLYEGFGIPILEAFASNCPVVLSNSSCFPEVAGNAAEYFDGNNVTDITQVLINLLNNDVRRNELRELGQKRLELFSWVKTAQETVEFYKDVITNASK